MQSWHFGVLWAENRAQYLHLLISGCSKYQLTLVKTIAPEEKVKGKEGQSGLA